MASYCDGKELHPLSLVLGEVALHVKILKGLVISPYLKFVSQKVDPPFSNHPDDDQHLLFVNWLV